MPCSALDSSFSAQIIFQRKCPKADDSHHWEVAQTLLYLERVGLEPVNVSLGCGCKMKLHDIPGQLRGAKGVHRWLKLAKKPSGGKSTRPRAGMTNAENRKRLDEAQLKLWPNTRR
jgi:hypothetical protein